MNEFLLILSLTTTLWPAVPGLVKTAETLIPGHQKGKDKLNLVLEQVGVALEVASGLGVVPKELPKNHVLDVVTALVNKEVGRANAAGELTHGA